MEIHFETDYSRGELKIWLTSMQGQRRAFFHYDGKNLIETIQESPAIDDKIKPFLVLPFHFADDVIKLIADHANKTGVKTERRDFVEGELIATKKHLEDLQKAFDVLLKTNTPS